MAATLTFDYSVRDRSGALVSGKMEADSPAAVAQRLKSLGYAPVSISSAKGGMNKELSLPSLGAKVKLKDLAIFSRQFATMIGAGLSLLRSLTILEEQTESKELARVLGDVRQDVETGQALSKALSNHPKVFPPLMVNMIRAGEAGGFLDAVLVQISENYEAEVKLRGKIKSAMAYPTVVFFVAILAVIGMLLFIVPVFAGIFSSLGGHLPLPTQILVDMSHLLKNYFPFFLVAIIAAWIAWSKNRNRAEVRRVVDPLKLKVPIFGELFRKIAIARFARNLGTLVHSGVPILQSLDIVADTTGNVVIGDAIRDIQDSVRSGESISAPLSQHAVFPPMVVQMMSVGEDTGALDAMLGKIAEFYDQEVEATSEALTALIEPLMIVVLGSIIGAMIVALYLPIFDVYNLVNS